MSSRHGHGHGKTCANCQSRPAEKGRPDSLCAKCVHKLPRSQCHYCRVAIHLLARHADRPPAQHLCDKCASDTAIYGVPRVCQLCKFQAAFDGAAHCRHCQSSFERFGAAVRCDKCGYDCAFQKDAESLQKVDGRTLCFICTHSYKALRKKEAGSGSGGGGESMTEAQRASLQAAWQRRDAEKRPREEDVEAELQRQQQQQQSNKRQRTEGPAAAASASAASAATILPPSSSPSASPSPSPSPQPAASATARASPILSAGASPFSLAALSGSSLGSSTGADSTAELLARISKLEKENADLRRGNEERTQKLLVLGARAAESKKTAEDAVAERMRRDKEVNQLRGELEAAKRALLQKKDLDASKAQTEALRSLAATGPNPNNVPNAKVASAAHDDDDTADIKI